MGVQIISDASKLPSLFENYMKGFERVRPDWQQDHPDLDNAADVVAREYFSLIKNHWDVFLDVTHCSGTRVPSMAQAARAG
jgi:hypothetical protein